MIDAIEVADTQCNGGDARGQRLSGDGYNVRCSPFTVTDQVQRFGARVLSAIAVDRPFAGNAGVKNRIVRVVALPESSVSCNLRIIVDDGMLTIDSLICDRQTSYDNVRGHHIIAARTENRFQRFVLLQCTAEISEMLVLVEGCDIFVSR